MAHTEFIPKTGEDELVPARPKDIYATVVEYKGADAKFVTLSGDTPEHAWIVNTMFRRWLHTECICGCGRCAYDDGEAIPDWDDPESGRRYLRPDCVDQFVARLQSVRMAENWQSLFTDNRWDGPDCGAAMELLQEIYQALWTADIAQGLQQRLRDAQADLARIRQVLGD